MKNKRNVLIAFILICCLCLSIGYAALTDTLIINGNVSVNAAHEGEEPTTPVEKSFDEDLGWTKVILTSSTSVSNNASWTVTSGSGDSATNITSTGVEYNYLDEVTFNVSGFAEAGDNVVLTYTIGNKHPDLSATITNASVTGATEYFSIVQEITDNNAEANNGTATVKVTVTMIKTPIEDKSATMKLTYTATAVEKVAETPADPAE